MAMSKALARALALTAFVVTPAIADNSRAITQHTTDPKTGIETWQMRDDGVEIVLIQISPDQARGFFLARGFQRADVDYYAASCVFATVVKNQSASPVSYHLADWRYTTGEDRTARKLKLKNDWLREWKQRGVSKSARIAFEWSQHPTEQVLEPNDWNQGMTTYQVPHGNRFDLTVKWTIGEKKYADTIEGVRCAK